MSGNVDIESIMDEIREEAKKNGANGIVPAFEDVPMMPAAPKIMNEYFHPSLSAMSPASHPARMTPI